MGLGGSLLARSAADAGIDLDDTGLVGLELGVADGGAEGLDVRDVGDGLDVPSVGLVALPNVLSEGEIGGAIDRDVVIIV